MVSYLQYPIMLAALIYYIRIIGSLAAGVPNLSAMNQILTLMGVALSFSTLQDTKKTQNKLSLRVWTHKKAGKWALYIMTFMAMACIGFGIYGMHMNASGAVKDLSIGLTIFGIGCLGLVKSALEMYEYHQQVV